MTQAPGNPPASPEAGWPWAATIPRQLGDWRAQERWA
jgi:hypothetical protein